MNRRSKPLRPRSLKQARLYQQRRRFVAAFLEAVPICQRCNKRRSVDVHEVKTRARGGSILDERNCRALCRECHDWIGTHPTAAEAEGWLAASWAGDLS